MSFYSTPSKPPTKKLPRVQTQDKPTDWICMLCNNLNFSFRKNCNRCKVQSRVQNENQMANTYEGYYCQSENFSSESKIPFGDRTNCDTPKEKVYFTECKDVKISTFANLNEFSLIKPSTLSNSSNFLECEYWENLNIVEPEGETEESEDEQNKQEKSICEFTDMELECLISKILIEDQ